MEILQMETVAAIAQAGSITKAAEKLFLTQSAVSQKLKKIETDLGVELFSRRNKKMVINELGVAVVSKLDKIKSEVNDLYREIDSLKSQYRPKLRLSTECYTVYNWFSGFMLELDPKIRDSFYPIIDSTYTRQPFEALKSGKLDFAIVTNTPPIKNVVYDPLFNDELIGIVSKENSLSQRDYLIPKDFKNQCMIEYNTDSKNIDAYRLFFNPASVKINHAIKIELTEAIVEMVRANFGVAILSKWIATNIKDLDGLSFKSLGRRGIQRPWYLAYDSGRPKEIKDLILSLKDNLIIHLSQKKTFKT